MRQFALTAAKGGINRLRDKGGASQDTLYDLVNGYVTQTSSIRPRPGTRLAYTLPEGTIGMCAFREKLHVFSHNVILAPVDPMVVINVLRHPTAPVTMPLKAIHFAAPFLGYLYVVAEWLNGDVLHYWIQNNNTWQPNHMYIEGEIVQPTVPNGYAYQAHRLGPVNPVWKALEPHTVGDVREPTSANGFKYTVVDTLGVNPASGSTEPTWPEEDGALVYEDVTGDVGSTTTPSDPTTTVPPDVEDRYGTGVNANRSSTGSLK